MRFLTTTALAALLTVTAATQADAGRRSSTSQELMFIANTPVPAQSGGTMSFCMLVEKESAFFIPFWISAESYAMADNGCASDSYVPVDAAMIAELKTAQIIPADTPAHPTLTLGQRLSGAWGMGIGAGLLGFAGIGAAKKSKRKTARRAAMGSDASPEAMAILDVMCHAAKADGEIDPEEITMIADIAQQMTGTAFEVATVRQMIELSETNLQASDFKALTKKLDTRGRTLAMQGALQVCAADGTLAGAEQQFIGGLAHALKMTNEEVGGFLNQIAGQPT